ncbi:MAG: EamA family transporter RarD [Planctomycetota bacterium]
MTTDLQEHDEASIAAQRECETPFATPSDAEQEIAPPAPGHAGIGVVYGLLAYGTWGTVVPLYFRAVRDVSPLELVAHRVLWGLPTIALMLTLWRRWSDYVAIVTNPRALAVLAVTTVLIAINWLGFVYAVANDRLIEVSLGYYINPLVSIGLGMIFLGERLRRAQWVSVAIAATGVSYLALQEGVPELALIVAFSFGFYGLLRKRAHADALVGLSVEMTLLFPLVLVYMSFLFATGTAGFLGPESETPPVPRGVRDLLIPLAGLVTIGPLLWFALAARRLKLATIGFLQYIAPTGQLLLAIVVGEQFDRTQVVVFVLIWAALILYSVDSARAHRASRRPDTGE